MLDPKRKHHFLGVDFAPFRIPFERRLQTVAVLIWVSLFLFFTGFSVILLTVCIFVDTYRWIACLYIAWAIYDWKTPYFCGRKNKSIVRWFRGSRLWQYYCDFYPIKLIKTADLDPQRSYLAGSHPHGMLCSGAFGVFATDAVGFENTFPGLNRNLLTLQGQFWFPLYREIFLATGTAAATKESMERLLSIPKGQISILVTGGVLEAMNAGVGDKIKLVLKQRKGWIKLALRFGVDLVPTFSFGEHSIYGQMHNPEGSYLRKMQLWFESWAGFSPVMMMGRGIFQYNYGIIPRRHPINVVIGKPIKVDRIESPSSQEIEDLQKKYCQAVRDLYEEYNPIYGDPKLTLEIA